MFRYSVRQKEGPAFGFAPRGRGRLARVMVGAVFCSGPGASWVAHPRVARILRPGADAAGGLGTMRGSGAPTLGPGELGSGGRTLPAPPNKRRRGASARAGKSLCEAGAEASARRPAQWPGRAREGRAPRPRSAGLRPSTWCVSFPPPAAAAGPPGPLVMFTYRERESGLRSVHILRASHTDARLRHSQPANSLIGGPRPPARITAGPRPRRRRRRSRRLRPPLSPPELEPSPPSRPCSPLRGRGGGGGGREGGGGRSGGRVAFSSPPRPFPVGNANAPSSGFHPEHVQTDAGGAFLPYPMSGGGPAGEAGERLPFRTLPVVAAWAPNGGRSGETSERGYESLANRRWDLQDFRSFLALVVAGATLDHTLAGFLPNRSDGLREEGTLSLSFPSPDTLRPRSIQ